MPPSPFLNQVHEVIRLRHLSLSTEDSYLYYMNHIWPAATSRIARGSNRDRASSFRR